MCHYLVWRKHPQLCKLSMSFSITMLCNVYVISLLISFGEVLFLFVSIVWRLWTKTLWKKHPQSQREK